MFRLSRKTDYSLRALKHLLTNGEHPSSAREIAQANGIPFEVLAKLLQTLARKGLLVSQHGTKGGYSPVRDSGSLTVREVMEAIEGPTLLVTREDSGRKSFAREGRSHLGTPLSKVQEKVLDVLGRTTLKEI